MRRAARVDANQAEIVDALAVVVLGLTRQERQQVA